jgi:acetyl-CoA synthetase
MPQLTEVTTYDDVMRSFSWDRLWALFDGDRDRMNLAHECLDRHQDQGTAISIKFANGHREYYDYATLSELSSRFANWLTTLGIGHGDRVAIVLDPGKAFYVKCPTAKAGGLWLATLAPPAVADGGKPPP